MAEPAFVDLPVFGDMALPPFVPAAAALPASVTVIGSAATLVRMISRRVLIFVTAGDMSASIFITRSCERAI